MPAILYIDRPDEASTNLYTSPQVEDLMGFTVEEWTSATPNCGATAARRRRDRVIAAHRLSNERGERFLAEYRLFAKDGHIVWIRDEAVPVRERDGTLLYWRGVMLDITERKEAEDSSAGAWTSCARRCSSAASSPRVSSRPRRRSGARSPPTSTTTRSR